VLAVIVGTAAAVALSRRAPSVALIVVWVVFVVSLLGATPTMLAHVAIAYVAFGTARWGSTGTVWLSGLSIPAAGLMAYAVLVADRSYYLDLSTYGRPSTWPSA